MLKEGLILKRSLNAKYLDEDRKCSRINFDQSPASTSFIEGRSVIDRTITARTFVELIKIEALQSLVRHLFSASEISAIESTIKN